MASRATWTLSRRETLRHGFLSLQLSACSSLKLCGLEEVPPLWASMSSAVKGKVWTRGPLRGPSGSNSL